MWRSERRVSWVPERFRHREEHTPHCSLFMCKPVGKASELAGSEIE